jgi:hypothetical protein
VLCAQVAYSMLHVFALWRSIPAVIAVYTQ